MNTNFPSVKFNNIASHTSVTQSEVCANNSLFHSNVSMAPESYKAYHCINFKSDIDDKISNKLVQKLLSMDYESFGGRKEILLDIGFKLSLVRDSKVRAYVNNLLKTYIKEMETASPDEYFQDFQEADDLLDVVNCAKEKYVNCGPIDIAKDFKSNVYKYYEYIKENCPDDAEFFLKNIKDKYNHKKKTLKFEHSNLTNTDVLKDFLEEQKYEPMKEFLCCQGIGNDELKNYLYENYYLKNIDFSDRLKDCCRKINSEFGVKIFLTNVLQEHKLSQKLKEVEGELSQWKTVGGQNVRLPLVINFMVTELDYIKDANTKKRLNTAASASSGIRKINLKPISMVEDVLRHEIMHLNDTAQMLNGSIYRGRGAVKTDISEIIKHKEIEKNGRTYIVPDMSDSKFAMEFLKAGISDEHVKYAYTNRDEFVAVAAEGDMSRYSDEFKEILIDLGIPEWVFNLKNTNPNVKNNIESHDAIIERLPDIEDYDDYVFYKNLIAKTHSPTASRVLSAMLELYNDITEPGMDDE